MKTRYIISFLLFASLICNAQAVYLTTPKGTRVYAFELIEMPASEIQRLTAETKKTIPSSRSIDKCVRYL